MRGSSARVARRGRAASFVTAIVLGTSGASAAENVSTGGRVETDLWTSTDGPPAALLDGSTDSHFTQHRLEDADFRVWLKAPATVETVSFVQGWSDWSQALDVRLEAADGSTVDLTLKPGTRDVQSFPVHFKGPTAFIDVWIRTAQKSKSGDGWGGFAEMTVSGTFAGADATPPKISGIQVTRTSDTNATVTWTTDEPATSQLRYSTDSVAAQTTTADTSLVTSHSVTLSAASPLRGRLEIRSADAAGNRAEVRHDAFVTLDTAWQWGTGGLSFQLNGKWVPATDVFAQDGLPLGFSQSWVGSGDWASWYTSSAIAGVRKAGLTPEAIHYFFGDPVLSDVQARSAAYLADIDALGDVLQKSGVGDQTIVTLEPEFNQGEVATWDGWNDLMIDAIGRLHTKAGARVGLLAGDWDIDHAVTISMGRAAAKADFVAFQEMRASTRDTPDDAKQVVSHAIRFSHYLSRKFLRPVRWGYLMVSDYGGWAAAQRDVVIELCERKQELADAGVVAVSWMSYLDSPGSEGYFGEGEAHKGLKYADATPKPAFAVWKECVLHGASWKTGGGTPPGEIPAVKSGAGCGCEVGAGVDAGASVFAAIAVTGLGVAIVASRRRRR
jgi:hypothetical protein